MPDVKAFDQFGRKVLIPEADLDDALRLGYRVATPEDVKLEQIKEEYGGIPGAVGAAVTGVARGLTIGGSDYLLKQLGAEETIRNLELANPGISTVSEGVGMIAPAFFTEGASLGARALAATPAGLAARAGQAAGRAVGARLGAAATTIGGTAARVAAEGATEAALQGIASETTRLAIDNELSGEKIAQIGLKGLTSFGVGGVLGGGLGAGGALVSKAAQKIPTGLGKEFEKLVYRTHARKVGKTGDDILQAEQLAQPEIRRRALNAKDELADIAHGKQPAAFGAGESAPGSLVDNLDQKWSNGQQASELIRDTGLKKTLIRRDIADDADSVLAQRAFADQELSQALAEVERMRAAPGTEYGKAGLDMLEADLRRAIVAADEAATKVGKDGAAELYMALDGTAKRAVGRAVSRFERVRNPTTADNATAEVLKPIYERLRLGLENSNVWGGVGDLQRELNAPLTKAIRSNDMLMQSWYERTGFGVDPTNPWRSGRVASGKAVERNLADAANPGRNLAFEALKKHATDETAWHDAALKLGDWDDLPAMRDIVVKQTKINEKILQQLARAEETAKAGAFLESIGGKADSIMGLAAGAAVGVSNPAFALLAPLASPRMFARGAELVENIAAGQTGRVGAAVGRATRAIRDTSVAAARRLPVAGAMAGQFEERSKRVRDLASQAPAVRAALESQTSWLADSAPVTRQAAVNTALRQLEYLNANLPKGLAPSTPFAPALPPSRSEVAQWMRRLRAVENPTSILDDLAAGKLTPESIDAVRTVYPETFADIQGQVLDKLTTMEQRGQKPSYAKRVELGLLLGIPTDPTMTPESIAALQAQYQPTEAEAAGPQPAPPLGQAKGRKAPDFAAAYRSGSAETELTSEAT